MVILPYEAVLQRLLKRGRSRWVNYLEGRESGRAHRTYKSRALAAAKAKAKRGIRGRRPEHIGLPIPADAGSHRRMPPRVRPLTKKPL